MAINENKQPNQKLELERKRYLTIILTSNLILASIMSTILYFGFPGIEISIVLTFTIFIASSTTAASYSTFLVSIKRLGFKKSNSSEEVLLEETHKDLHNDYSYARSQFSDSLGITASLASEFRSPLTVLKNNLDNLESLLSPKTEVRKTLSNINSASFEIDTLINSAIYYTKFQERQLKLNFSERKLVDVFDLIRKQVTQLSESLGKKLRISILPNLPCIKADDKALSLALYNLLDFVIKNSSESIITINTKFVDDCLELDFSSKGNANIRETIDDFIKNDSNDLEKSKSNIAIKLAKILVEAHNGRLQIENQNQVIQLKIIVPISKN